MIRLLSRRSMRYAVALGMIWLPSLTVAQDSDLTSPGLSSGTNVDAEREEIWNSPEMLEARAELELTFKRSAKITDEQAARYMADLKAKSPDDMRVWLIQFQEQRAQTIQEQARASELRRASMRANLPAQNVGSFRNPVAPTGRPAAAGQRSAATPGRVQQAPKPFSSPRYSAANQPLVTSQEMARFEILRGPRPW